jgi:hypothetical protein
LRGRAAADATARSADSKFDEEAAKIRKNKTEFAFNFGGPKI